MTTPRDELAALNETRDGSSISSWNEMAAAWVYDHAPTVLALYDEVERLRRKNDALFTRALQAEAKLGKLLDRMELRGIDASDIV